MKLRTVRLVLYGLFFCLFAWIVLDDDVSWLEKTANLVITAALGYGARVFTRPRI